MDSVRLRRIAAICMLVAGVVLGGFSTRDYLQYRRPIPIADPNGPSAARSVVGTYTAQAVLEANRNQMEADRQLNMRFYLAIAVIGFGVAGMGIFFVVRPGTPRDSSLGANAPLSILDTKTKS